ncbi:MAG: hypothetical protein ACK2T4_09645 [Candidatus Promineifilaceae bacterium]
MSRTESWKVWLGIFAVLIFSGLMAAFWPAISENLLNAFNSSTSSGSSMRVPAETVTFPPLPIPGLQDGITLNSVQILLGLSFLVIGAVVVTGIIITIVNLLISRWITNVETSDSYQEGTAVLAKKEAAELAQEREESPAATTQQNDYSRWAVIATSMAILFFAIIVGYLVGSTLFPSGQIVNQDQIVNITAITSGVFFLLTLLYLALRMDRERLNDINSKASAGIPWDAIIVILFGVLVVGLGIGITIFVNLPG